MDKEDIAMSHQSTMTSSDLAKATSADSSLICVHKNKSDLNLEFEELVASVSDSGDETSEIDQASEPHLRPKPDLGITRKQLIRKRKLPGEPQSASGHETKCSNGLCNVVARGDRVRLLKTKYLANQRMYCEQCSQAIRNKWTCPCCKAIYTDISHCAEKDPLTWIECDNPKCKRWTHMECEEAERDIDVRRSVADPQYKFYCGECVDTYCRMPEPESPTLPRKQPSASGLRLDNSPPGVFEGDPDAYGNFFSFSNKFEVFTSVPYTYLFSENYKTIDKLVLDKGKPLQATDRDLCEDFDYFFASTRDKKFIVADKKSTSLIPPADRPTNRKKQYKSML